ncbi:MAG: sialidase family protein, partial [Anaerolineaceae bacterium]
MSLTLFRRLRRPVAVALVAAASTLASLSGVAQTALTTGGAEVRGFLARSSTIVYAAAYGGGLYKSTDAGATWARVDMPANERYLTSVAGNSASYMVVGADEGLLRSADGTSFTRILHEPVVAVAVAPGTSQVVLAGIKGVGVVRSADSGVTFTMANNTALDSLDVTALAFDPSNANVAYVATRPDGLGSRGGVFRSSDGGTTWTAHTGLPSGNNFVSSLAVDGNGMAYAGVLRPSDGAGDVYFRTSSGSSWSRAGTASVPEFFGVVSLHRDANTGTSIWAGSRGLGLRNGSGTSWSYMFSQTGQPNLFYTGINAVGTLPGSSVVLKAIRGAGVWRSSAAASPRSWTRVSFPGADRILSASGVAGSTSTLLAGLYAGGVWRSTDSGSTFTSPTVDASQADFSFGASASLVAPFVSIWELSASVTNASLVYAAAGGVGMYFGNDNPGLFRFNGMSWGGVGNNVPTGAPWNGNTENGIALNIQQVYGVSVNRANDQVAYTSYLTPGGVFTRSGASWAQVVPPGVTPQVRAVVTSANSSKLLALPFDDKATLS